MCDSAIPSDYHAEKKHRAYLLVRNLCEFQTWSINSCPKIAALRVINPAHQSTCLLLMNRKLNTCPGWRLSSFLIVFSPHSGPCKGAALLVGNITAAPPSVIQQQYLFLMTLRKWIIRAVSHSFLILNSLASIPPYSRVPFWGSFGTLPYPFSFSTVLKFSKQNLLIAFI